MGTGTSLPEHLILLKIDHPEARALAVRRGRADHVAVAAACEDGVLKAEWLLNAKPESGGRNGENSLTLRDVPMGSYAVDVQITRARWKVRVEGKRISVSTPLPPSLTGRNTGNQERTSSPGNPGRSRGTPALEEFMTHAGEVLGATATQVADMVNLPRDNVDDARKRMLAEADADRRHLIRPTVLPLVLGIDDLFIRGVPWTVLTDNTRRAGKHLPRHERLLGLLPTREKTQVQALIEELLSWYPPGSRLVVTMDMWEPFREAVLDAQAQQMNVSVRIVPDRFHYVRLVRKDFKELRKTLMEPLAPATRKAVLACTGAPCSCQHPVQCNVMRSACILLGHMSAVWELTDMAEVQAHRQKWDSLLSDHRALPAGDRRHFNATNHQWQKWQTEFDGLPDAWKHLGYLANNGAVEQFNGVIRRTIEQQRLWPQADNRLSIQDQHARATRRLLFVLRRAPVIAGLCRPVTAVVPATTLKCPTCGGSVTVPANTPQHRIRHLPKGLAPVTLILPVRVDCQECKVQDVPECLTDLTPALKDWLLRRELSHWPDRTLQRVSGLGRTRIADIRAMLKVTALPRYPEHLSYSELWTPKRVWMLLSTREGRLADLWFLDRPADTSRAELRKTIENEVQRRLRTGPNARATYDLVQLHIDSEYLRNRMESGWHDKRFWKPIPVGLPTYLAIRALKRLRSAALTSELSRVPQSHRPRLRVLLEGGITSKQKRRALDQNHPDWVRTVRQVHWGIEILSNATPGNLGDEMERWCKDMRSKAERHTSIVFQKRLLDTADSLGKWTPAICNSRERAAGLSSGRWPHLLSDVRKMLRQHLATKPEILRDQILIAYGVEGLKVQELIWKSPAELLE